LGVHRRLIIRPGAIGDFILALPAMEFLTTGYTEVWAASQNLPLARFAQRTRSIAATGLDMLEFAPSEKLQAELSRFDSIISWYGTNRPTFRDAVQGLPFQFLTTIPAEDCRTHAADYFAIQVGCPLPAISHIDCARQDAGFAVLHPFSGSLRKCWPLERFQELARRLERHLPVRWCAGPDDALPGAVRIADLYELACWLATARVYIGNDSGITHLAASVGIPVIALFGPTDPRIWAPRGDQIRILAKPRLADITVEEVLARC
jgi:heptosyltransferase-3